MAINRRDFLKFSAGTGLMLTAGATPGTAAQAPQLSKDAVGILYDSTLCIGCKSCMVNCKLANAEPGGALYHKETAGKIPFDYPAGDKDKIYDAPKNLSSKTLCVIKAYRNDGKDKPSNGSTNYSFIKEHCLHCIAPA
jgi:Fe-S-cluster-containing dehydrogenase component